MLLSDLRMQKQDGRDDEAKLQLQRVAASAAVFLWCKNDIRR